MARNNIIEDHFVVDIYFWMELEFCIFDSRENVLVVVKFKIYSKIFSPAKLWVWKAFRKYSLFSKLRDTYEGIRAQTFIIFVSLWHSLHMRNNIHFTVFHLVFIENRFSGWKPNLWFNIFDGSSTRHCHCLFDSTIFCIRNFIFKMFGGQTPILVLSE